MKSIKQTNQDLKDKLLDRIESEGVSPKPKLWFQTRECLVWLVWILSVAIGAIAVAVSLFVVFHSQYALYEATHTNAFTHLVDVLPYAWLSILVLMSLVAIFNLRHTARGYRRPLSSALLTSLVLAIAGGSALQVMGVGSTIDDILGNNMQIYASQAKLEKQLWQLPSEGRLIGRQIHSTLTPTSTIIFRDISGISWQMDVSELHEEDLDKLASGKTVKLLGTPTNKELNQFHACGAFPCFMGQEEVSACDMRKEKRDLIARMARFSSPTNETDTKRRSDLPSEEKTPDEPDKIECADSPAVQKIAQPAS